MKKIRLYPYLFFLSVSFLIAAIIWKTELFDIYKEPAPPLSGDSLYVSDTLPAADEQMTENFPTSETVEPPQEESEVMSEPEPQPPTFFTADRSYFDDTLFIGDSRTVGLYEYGDLGNAIVLADSGMSVYKIFKQSFSLDSGEKLTLEELLTQKTFGKIYIMLGINELGYNFDQTVRTYKEMVATIEEAQPDALIFLQANLHITEKKSGTSSIYNNVNINRFNSEIEKMADSQKRFYLDANELFDDENGNLSTEYTVDESHVLGKYYADWVDWILQYAVSLNNDI